MDVIIGRRRWGLLLVELLQLRLNDFRLRHVAGLIASPDCADIALPVDQQLCVRGTSREHPKRRGDVFVSLGYDGKERRRRLSEFCNRIGRASRLNGHNLDAQDEGAP
jgi:hypothetical protein